MTPQETVFFQTVDPWGFILFARNVDAPDQLRALTAELRATVGRNAPVLIDQEGGRVARLRPPHWLEWPAPIVQAAKVDGPRALWAQYRLIAAELQAVGIDVNCAPMADVPQKGVHEIIYDRCYGVDAAAVTTGARAVAQGLLAGGILPIIKHIPGHGRPIADSHLELPVTHATRAQLQAVDFAPFRALNDLPMAMTAHVVYSQIDAARPATLSPDVIGVIRDDIGFDGLLMSDDISMKALRGRLGSLAAKALAAGCDVVLHCNGVMAEMREIADAVGALSTAGADRAARALKLRKMGAKFDRAALLAQAGAGIKVAHND